MHIQALQNHMRVSILMGMLAVTPRKEKTLLHGMKSSHSSSATTAMVAMAIASWARLSRPRPAASRESLEALSAIEISHAI